MAGKLGHPAAVQKPYPPVFFGGSSPSAHQTAAKHADVYLTWAEPPHLAAEQIQNVRRLAEAEERSIRFGIHLHIIVRETEREAWEAADNLIKYAAVQLPPARALNKRRVHHDVPDSKR